MGTMERGNSVTPEKRNALLYVVAGVLWPGVIALLVVTQLLIPDMQKTLSSAKPYSGPMIAKVGLVIWIGSLVWPTLIACLEGVKRGKPWDGYKRARWFFWLSFVLSPFLWPFMFNT